MDRRSSLQPLTKECRLALEKGKTKDHGPVFWDDMEDGDRTRGYSGESSSPRELRFNEESHKQYVPAFPTGCRGLFQLMESPLLLITIGIFSSCCVLAVDYFITLGERFRYDLAQISFIYLILYSVIMACLAAAVVSIISPQASGSGLPEMKVAISGVIMKKYLSFRCFSAKILGLILASASGLSIGKEGPFIMITCAFAEMIISLPIYRRIKEDTSKHLEMLACACAAAVSATFGTPFGGVLFSVEVTSTFYMVRNLPRSFFAAVVGAVTMSLLEQLFGLDWLRESSLGIGRLSASNDDSLPNHLAKPQDIAIFALVGIICGLLAACFTAVISELVVLRNWYLDSATTDPNQDTRWWDTPLARKVTLVAVVATCGVFIEYFGDSTWFFKRGSQKNIFDLIFRPLSEDDDVSLYDQLQLFFPLKFLLTALCVTLPVPAGIFAPTFLIGGLVGRIMGQLCVVHVPWLTTYRPHEFAIIGAAAFSAGVTRAISTAVIVLELGNGPAFSIPVSIAILAAYFTGGRFIENVYDVLISTNHLPRLKKLPKAAYDIPAWEVMVDVANMGILTIDSTYRDIQRLLATTSEPVYPIVSDTTNMMFLGAVSRFALEDAVSFCGSAKLDETASNVKRTKSFRHYSLGTGSNFAKMESQPRSKSFHGQKKADTDATSLNMFDMPVRFAYLQGGSCIRWVRQL